jgi:tetratricopeptide (TPR) repeat protein
VSENVRLLSAKRSAYDLALDAFARGEFELCERYVRLCRPGSDASFASIALLTARLARIEGDFERWYEASGAAARGARSERDRLTASALRALAAKRLGKTVEATRWFGQVETSISGSAPADAAYAAYLLAADAWGDRDLARARALIGRNLRSVRDPESLALLGWIEVREERYRSAGTRFLTALARLRSGTEIDLRLQGRLVHALGIVASETVDLRLGHRARREYEAMVWPESLRVERFNALTCLRFLALLEGDIERAWVLSRDAIAVAPRPAYVAIAETNAAAASRLLGDDNAYHLQLRRAWEIVRGEKWGHADAEERVALTNFMIEGGFAMPQDVRKAATLYQSLSERINRGNALESDRRVTAFEAFAAGRVYEMLGAHDDAIRAYQRSLELWSVLGYDMRAALVALDLRRLTRDERYRAPIDAVLTRAPNAWFGAHASPTSGRRPKSKRG